MLASLEHPHIVPIYDYVEHEGMCLLIMELLQGGTVWQRFTTEGITPQAACGIVLAACTALQYAHEAGVLHRDIKPENLLFTANGTVKVSDYGIAKVLGDTHTKATRTGEVLGTPAYMAPEQALGTELTPATDIYALGVLTYELLAGTLPFPDDGNALGLLYRRVHEQPTPITQTGPQVPRQLAQAVMHSLATDPADRPASAEAFGVELADACNTAWGSGWAHESGISVRAPGAIADRLSGRHPTSASVPPPISPVPAAPAPATIIEGAPVTPTGTTAPATEITHAAPGVAAAAEIAAPVATPAPAATPAVAEAEPTKRSGVRLAVWLVLALLVAGGVGAYFAFGSSGGNERAAGATTVRVPGSVQWTDTGVGVKPGDKVAITATGSVFSSPDGKVPAGPDGYPDPTLHQFNLIASGDHAGLIARVGENGVPFPAGASARFTSGLSGHLFLGINDDGVDNNRGAFEAKVTVAPR